MSYFDLTRIGGKHIYYYLTCRRQLWLYQHQIRFQDLNDRVQLGQQVHEEHFKRTPAKELATDGIKVDFVGKGALVHEVKSSSRYRPEHAEQLRYYMFILKNEKGICDVTGVLHYPEINQRIPVTLISTDEERLLKMVDEISKINDLPSPPPIEQNRKFCQKCSYYDYCYI